jgi:hypothetical protein
MVFNAVLLVEETEVPGENHYLNYFQTNLENLIIKMHKAFWK